MLGSVPGTGGFRPAHRIIVAGAAAADGALVSPGLVAELDVVDVSVLGGGALLD